MYTHQENLLIEKKAEKLGKKNRRSKEFSGLKDHRKSTGMEAELGSEC